MLPSPRPFFTLELQVEGVTAELYSPSIADAPTRAHVQQKLAMEKGEILCPGEWRIVPPFGKPEVILLMASRDEKDTQCEITSLREHFHTVPILLLIDRETVSHLGRSLQLDADDFHELKGGPTLLKARIEKWRSRPPSASGANRLSIEEAAIWRTLFQRAGAGLLTGRPERLLQTLPQQLPGSLKKSRDWNTFIQDALGEIQWEINNQTAAQLLELKEPVSLSNAFTYQLEAFQPQKFASELLLLGRTQSTIVGEFLFTSGSNPSRKLVIEFNIPTELENIVLVTLTDITQRMNLELNLRDHVNMLESRVEERTRNLIKANAKLGEESEQRKRLASQVRDNLVNITQGVISAKKILDVALPGRMEMRATFPRSILLDRPRDIMGGDFLFTAKKKNKKFLALIDSTGHGIPGAMVSLMGSTLINRAFAELENPTPSLILNQFHHGFKERMMVRSESSNMYGFDAGILMLDDTENTVEFAGARGDLFLVRDGQTYIFRGTRNSIELNRYGSQDELSFELHTIPVQDGDQFYMVTDGVRDQFGGVFNHKLGRKRLADLLAVQSHRDILEREKALQQSLLLWKGANAKVDDATLVGVDIPVNPSGSRPEEPLA